MNETRTKEIRILVPEELFSLIFPGETLTHLLNARKEMLLALRSLIDAKIEAIEKKQMKKTGPSKKIKIE